MEPAADEKYLTHPDHKENDSLHHRALHHAPVILFCTCNHGEGVGANGGRSLCELKFGLLTIRLTALGPGYGDKPNAKCRDMKPYINSVRRSRTSGIMLRVSNSPFNVVRTHPVRHMQHDADVAIGTTYRHFSHLNSQRGYAVNRSPALTCLLSIRSI